MKRGRQGLFGVSEPEWFKRAPRSETEPIAMDQPPEQEIDAAAPPIDRTVKLYIAGKQARPDSGYSIELRAADGQLLGGAPLGNRKGNRNTAEAAHTACGDARPPVHTRAH